MSINNMAIKNLSLHFQRVFHSSVSTSARRFDVFMVRFLCGLALLLIAAFVFYAIPESAPVIRMLDLFDKHLMVLLNYDGGSTLDAFWYTFSSKYSTVPLILALFYFFFQDRFKWYEMLFFVLSLVVVVALCDTIASAVIKPYACRLRPSRSPMICDLLHFVNGYRSGLYGFVSSHAVNAFGVVTYMSLVFRKKIIIFPLVIWAICICYSRIYLGVHYPGDILFGSMIGVTIGGLAYYAFRYFYVRVLMKRYTMNFYTTSAQRNFLVLNISIFGTIFCILCYSLVINL